MHQGWRRADQRSVSNYSNEEITLNGLSAFAILALF